MATAPTGLTYLQLVNRARRECGVSGADLVTLQSGLTYEGQRFKDWINEAWNDVQLMRSDWLWMRVAGTFQTVQGTAAYSLTTIGAQDLGDWRRRAFRAYTTSVGSVDEQILPFMEYDTWRDVYQFGAMRTTQGRPVAITVAPDRSLALGPVPNDSYTVVYEYTRAPSDLSADADSPCGAANGLSPRYQMLVVYKAMKSYAAYEAAPEVMERGVKEERRLQQQMMTYGLPTITAGPPLA